MYPRIPFVLPREFDGLKEARQLFGHVLHLLTWAVSKGSFDEWRAHKFEMIPVQQQVKNKLARFVT